VAEIHIPTGPLDEPPPFLAIRPLGNQTYADAKGAALAEALDGLDLGKYDQEMVERLRQYEMALVTVICSWIARARAAEIEGKVVLDEVDEIGIADNGRDVLWVAGDSVILNTHGMWSMDADEAEEWAAHLATMARALRQQAAARGDS
jgi:hypothetical protein